MKTVAVIQCNYVGWEGSTDVSLRVDPNGNYVIEEVMEKAKKLKQINARPIIACPDLEENRIFERLSRDHGCEVYFGSNNNVLDRLLKATRVLGGERVAWLQGIHFFLDVELMDKFLVWSEKFDYARCPDATLKFSLGQSININSLNMCNDEIAFLPEEERAFFSARPFEYMRRSKNFRIGLFDEIPPYSIGKIEKMRSIAKSIYVEERAVHTDQGINIGDISCGRYKNILHLIQETGVVLDIACGSGYGTKMIYNGKRKVIGVDNSPEAIEVCNEKHGDFCEFRIGNAMTIPMDNESVDFVVSIANIEHVENDKKFIKEIYRVLKPNGHTIIFTPQNRMGERPIWPWHFREYSLQQIKAIVEVDLTVLKIYGWQHGVVSDDPIGDGMYVYAKKLTIS